MLKVNARVQASEFIAQQKLKQQRHLLNCFDLKPGLGWTLADLAECSPLKPETIQARLEELIIEGSVFIAGNVYRKSNGVNQ